MESAEYDPVKVFEDVFVHDKKRLKRWLGFAAKYLDLYGNKVFERHWTPTDIIQEVVTRILEGKRKYDPDRYKNFDQFVFWTIRSIISKKFKTRKIVVPVESFEDSDNSNKGVNLAEHKYKTEDNFILEDFEFKTKFEKCYQQILDKDEEAALVLLCWKDEMTNQEIAKELGMEISKVEAAKKRIR